MRQLKVLFIEDTSQDALIIRTHLEKHFVLRRFQLVENFAQLEHWIGQDHWDLVLSEYGIDALSGAEALALVRARNERLPFLVVSGKIGEEATAEIMKFGADDVVLKNNLGRLPFAIERTLRSSHIRESEVQARKTAERAVRAREQMLTVVSHDLRNPLGAIQLNAETIAAKIRGARNLKDVLPVLGHVQSIVRSSLRMKSLIADVLDKVRIESGSFVIHRSERNLNDFLQEMSEVFSPLAAEKKITFLLSAPIISVTAHLDFERLYQILSNLIGNAIKFTPANGTITLKTELRRREIEFQVRDTGPGIDSENLEKIFQKYWQNQPTGEGVGLGLSIAKELVKAHEGRIWVESAKGYGTCFGFHIPCGWKEAPDMSLQPLIPKRICLVDDDDDLRDILEENLRTLGYEVISFANGHQALDGVLASDQSPDLMILDYRLPDMNGGEVIEGLRPRLQKDRTPVIFLSAEANLSKLATRHQAAAFITKPLRLRELSKVIETLLAV